MIGSSHQLAERFLLGVEIIVRLLDVFIQLSGADVFGVKEMRQLLRNRKQGLFNLSSRMRFAVMGKHSLQGTEKLSEDSMF